MSLLIAVDRLIMLVSGPDTETPVRVLQADPGQNFVWLFNCSSGRHLPFREPYRQLARRLKDGSAFVAPEDTYIVYPRLESTLSPKEIELRDRNWELIEPLVADGGLAMMYKETRHRLISDRIAECRTVTRHKVFDLLRRYWRGGQSRDALVPEFRNCGGRGKPKTRGDKWLGRPPAGVDRRDLVPLDGSNLEDAVILFRSLKTGHGAILVSKAYDETTRKIWGTPAIVRGREGTILADLRGVPSYSTLKYHAGKKASSDQDFATRASDRQYNLKHRPLTGRAAAKIFGPGQVFQVDATPWPVKIRSRLERAVTIGTATVFLVVDAYSQTIVGFHVTLKAERAAGALLAIAHALSDKGEYLRSIGLEPREGGFPPVHGFARILSDQGKAFTAELIEQGLNLLSITNAHTPPFRPDLKEAVENGFWRTQKNTRKRHKDGDAFGAAAPTHDEDGIYTLAGLERAIANAIMEANDTTRIRAVPDNWLSDDGTEPTAMRLHMHGLETLPAPAHVPQEKAILALWPRGVVRWNGKHLVLQDHWIDYRTEPGSPISMIRNSGSAERSYPCVYHPGDMSEVRLVEGNRLGQRLLRVGISSSTPRGSLAEIMHVRALRAANQPARAVRLAHERSKYAFEAEVIRAEELEAADGVVAAPVKHLSQVLRRIEQNLPEFCEAPQFVEGSPSAPEPTALPAPSGPSETTAVLPSSGRAAPSPAEAVRAARQRQREMARNMFTRGRKS